MADEPTVDNNTTAESGEAPAKKTTTRKSAAKRSTAKRTATKKAAATGTEDSGIETTGSETTGSETTASGAAKKAPAKRTTAKRTTKKAAASQETLPDTGAQAPAAEPDAAATEPDAGAESVTEAPAKKTTTRKSAAKKTAAKKTTAKKTAAKTTTAKKTTAKRTTKKSAQTPVETAEAVAPAEPAESGEATAAEQESDQASAAADSGAPAVLFQPPDATKATPRKRTSRRKAAAEPSAETGAETAGAQTAEPAAEQAAEQAAPESGEPTATAVEQPASAAGTEGQTEARVEDKSEGQPEEDAEDKTGDEAQESGGGRRRRRRGGRRRRKSGDAEATGADNDADNDNGGESDAAGDVKAEPQGEGQADTSEGDEQTEGGGSSRRRRRRRRSGESGGDNGDDSDTTVTKVRSSRAAEDQITALSGSTRLEAKKQRRREGREAGRRRAPIVSEAEFLARRESVDRVMVIRQREDLTQIGVLEDKVLVEHYVARESQTSLIGNVYLGRVQNVLPSMEAAFIDIGKGRNAVLYAGEVNWSALGWKEGQPRKIESVLTSGQKVLVQVTKDPIGHKGARLTSQISLAGRFLVYVPDGTTSGISRKLPDTERNRLKTLLKEIVPDSAGVIVRTAAEGASEDELTADVERLKARWEDIEKRSGGNAPQLLYGEPDLTLKVVRDLFTEDFSKLVIQGEDAWETVRSYVASVAPDLEDRLEKYDVDGNGAKDAFAAYRIDEQIAKGLDRKVWLPSGGSLIIDRTEAMTVVDVNTGKFTGSGGNLEETVTKNNLEAAEEIVRQLRLRDIGGIIVVDFIDMVLESNRDLVLRRLVECLGRDRTRHQVAEVTSLGLVQMTRKRIGTGLLEAFSETCEHCGGRGLVIHDHPVEPGKSSGIAADEPRGRRRRGRGKGGSDEPRPAQDGTPTPESPKAPTPAEFAAMAAKAEKSEAGERPEGDDRPAQPVEAAGSEQPEQPEQPDQQATTTPDEQAAKPTRARSTRGRSAKSEKTPVEAPVAAESAVTPLEPVAMEQPSVDPVVPSPSGDDAASDGSPNDGASTDAEPERPKVVTRTRRRAASRPAGSPAQVSEVQPVVVESSAVVPTPAPVAAPEPPKVITRTRRGASRPAGATAAEDSAGAVLVEDAAQGEAEEPQVEHVPVKKKGSRKR